MTLAFLPPVCPDFELCGRGKPAASVRPRQWRVWCVSQLGERGATLPGYEETNSAVQYNQANGTTVQPSEAQYSGHTHDYLQTLAQQMVCNN